MAVKNVSSHPVKIVCFAQGHLLRHRQRSRGRVHYPRTRWMVSVGTFAHCYVTPLLSPEACANTFWTITFLCCAKSNIAKLCSSPVWSTDAAQKRLCWSPEFSRSVPWSLFFIHFETMTLSLGFPFFRPRYLVTLFRRSVLTARNWVLTFKLVSLFAEIFRSSVP